MKHQQSRHCHAHRSSVLRACTAKPHALWRCVWLSWGTFQPARLLFPLWTAELCCASSDNGVRESVARYARAKLILHHGDGHATSATIPISSLCSTRRWSLSQPAGSGAFYGFPVAVCNDQNAPDSIARLREWSPDLIIFAGGNILRKQLLEVPRLGVLNVHLGLLPEIRGMSSPEWSLLNQIPVGITIHYVDAGIDTGPILQRCEFPDAARCESLSDLRNRLIAFGVEKIAAGGCRSRSGHDLRNTTSRISRRSSILRHA